MARQEVALGGMWRFQVDVSGDGEKVGYFDGSYDVTRWRQVLVPGSFSACMPGVDWYEGVGWFSRQFEVPRSWEGQRVVVRFEGVNYRARVWLNGRMVGENADGFLRFELPIGEAVRFGQTNVMVVRVDNARRPGEVPGMERGWRPFGGILREVKVVASGRVYIDHLRISAAPTETGGAVTIDGCVINGTAGDEAVELAVEVVDGSGQVCGKLRPVAAKLVGNGRVNVKLEGMVGGVKAWSPQTPVLYTARATLRMGGGVADAVDVRFGFRRIEVKQGKVLLNGRAIFLTGFNRHEDSPTMGMCPDLKTVRADLVDMKAAGANFVRLCHYPHHPQELDLCDEVGILVMGEIPLYWWNGLAEGEGNCSKKLDAAHRQLTSMILRDINHPSIIFWSVSNETQEQRPEVAAGNASLVSLAKKLDPTRLATHVSDHWRTNAHFEVDDVMCVNGYPTWFGRFKGPEYDVAEATRSWKDDLEKLHQKYPAKPILISEFGYPCVEDVHDGAMAEQMQAKAIEAEAKGMTAEYVVGQTIWCYADHPWPEENFIHYMTTSPFGVVTRGRKHKAGWEAAKRVFTAR